MGEEMSGEGATLGEESDHPGLNPEQSALQAFPLGSCQMPGV